MVRILNFCCFALAALSCLALYRVSEATRVAHIKLVTVERQINDDKSTMKVLQTEWERVSQPSRIQALAEARLGLTDTPSIAVASLELLPRRGDETPLAGSPVQAASTIAPDAHFHLVAAHAGN